MNSELIQARLRTLTYLSHSVSPDRTQCDVHFATTARENLGVVDYKDLMSVNKFAGVIANHFKVSTVALCERHKEDLFELRERIMDGLEARNQELGLSHTFQALPTA